MPPSDNHTDEAFNQSPPFAGINLFESDRALRDAVAREGASDASPQLFAFGAVAGSVDAFANGCLANSNPPKLIQSGPDHAPRDSVEFHPAYHEAMRISMAQGLHSSTWAQVREGDARRAGAHVARCAGSYMAAQMEAGHCCPITMTHASVATLLLQPSLAEEWLPKILSREYDPAFKPTQAKSSVTLGMGMTERQGGTDVRTNTTQAKRVSATDAEYRLTGHKWFISAPMSDAFLVLAQAPGGLSCFLMPRLLPDGSVNPIRLVALKDKLGNRSNASSEVQLNGAHAWLVGEEGRGVPAIIEMVTLTRLDCAVSSAGLMRFALAQAIHHAQHRTVFQKKLIDQPLMTQLLADLALDSEAATALAFRLARSFDGGSETETTFRRLMTPVIKYWNCKIAPNFAYETMECLGGNGYVEDYPLARLYREAPVNAIWEGSGNVMCLDVLRVLQKTPSAAELVLSELAEMAHGEARLAAGLMDLRNLMRDKDIEAKARFLVERLAVLTAACHLRAHAPACVSEGFIASRVSGGWRNTYGASKAATDARSIVERAAPVWS